MLFVHNDDRGNWEFAQFDAVIAQNKRDFDTRFGKAQALAAEGQCSSMPPLLLPGMASCFLGFGGVSAWPDHGVSIPEGQVPDGGLGGPGL